MDENAEDFIGNNNKYNNEKYTFNYENNDDNDYKEEFSEELDYNKLLSKNKYI